MPERDMLDRLVDDVLTTYAEPGPGLAPEILARVAAHHAAKRRALWLWGGGVAFAAAAAVLLAVIAPWRAPLPPHTAPRTQVAAASPRPLPAERAASEPRVRHATRRARAEKRTPLTAAAPLPKQQMFPARSPLSDQEQALVHLVAVLPPAQQEHFIQAWQQPVRPLHFAAISIPPLESTAPNER